MQQPDINGHMNRRMCLQQLLLFFLCSSSLQISFVSSELIYYGNSATERTTSGMDSTIQPTGPRSWIDDPLNCESCPRWGYLQLFHVYIHASSSPSSVPLPRLFLQIWSNSTIIGNYTLKWQKSLDNYQPGILYKVAPDAGQVVEVNERDRIGFTSDGNGSPVALDLEPDDPKTMSRSHRTYFRMLYRDSYVLPSVGDSKYVDNNALRGRFSIGIELDNAPPRKSTEVYLGHDLTRRQNSGAFPNPAKVIVDESIPLVSGRLTAFYFHLAQLTTVTSIQFYIWRKISSDSYILTYTGSVTLNEGPEKTHSMSINDGPQVNSSHRFGWYISSGLFFSPSSSGNCYYSLSSPESSNTVGQTYTFDGLSWPYEMSIGVIVDRTTVTNSVSSSSTSTTSTAPSTSTRPPSSSSSSTSTTSTAPSTSTRPPSSSSSSTSTTSMVPSTSTKPTTPGPPTPIAKSSSDRNEFSTKPSTKARPSESSDRNDVLSPAQGRSSESSAIHRNKMSILCFVVTLHLLIAGLSS